MEVYSCRFIGIGFYHLEVCRYRNIMNIIYLSPLFVHSPCYKWVIFHPRFMVHRQAADRPWAPGICSSQGQIAQIHIFTSCLTTSCLINYMMFPSYLHHIYTHRVFIIFTFIVSHWCFLTFKVCISMCTTYCDLNLPRFSGLQPASHWVFCMSSGPAMALPPAIQHPQVRRKRRDFEKRQHVELRAPVLRCVDWDGFVILRC